jgi:hypothetical protein
MSLKPDQSLISIGFDKNGECDFANSMRIAELSPAMMNELRRMIPVAIAAAEHMWCTFGPPSKQMVETKEAYDGDAQ